MFLPSLLQHGKTGIASDGSSCTTVYFVVISHPRRHTFVQRHNRVWIPAPPAHGFDEEDNDHIFFASHTEIRYDALVICDSQPAMRSDRKLDCMVLIQSKHQS
jgi:hypothetical protein